MYTENGLLIGRGQEDALLQLAMANRHGFVAGATGTGKTVTLKVMAESFSDAGVPVFFTDVKGDLSGTLKAGEATDNIQARLEDLGLADFPFCGYPVEFWDLYRQEGLPVRATISDMGPDLLSRLLDLNDTQSAILTILFRIADENGLLLLDFKDFKKMVFYVADHAKDFREAYGALPTNSLEAIRRKVIAYESQDVDLFFGEEALRLSDLMTKDGDGRGTIHILSAKKLFLNPTLYGSFLLWLLSDLYENLPEVGDLAKPKLVLFFDEAHLIFDQAPKVLLDKIDQVVRLIRSKGVGLYFVTQHVTDIPSTVLSQLANQVQHALRAYTPRDQATLKAVTQAFRNDHGLDLEAILPDLKVGQALVSFLDAEGRPQNVQVATILPPSSSMAPASLADIQAQVAASPLRATYEEDLDRESAYEVLEQRIQAQVLEAAQKAAQAQAKAAEKAKKASPVHTMTKSMMSAIGRQVGREIVRGIIGTPRRR